MSRKVVIIGAGAAGLTCAKQLIKSGFKVSIFEKSRGLGGRMASRRIENGIFNHGASRIPNFRIYSNVPKGLKSILETAVKKNILIPQKNHLTSIGGMKTFTSYLSEGLEIEKNSEIIAVKRVDLEVELHLKNDSKIPIKDNFLVFAIPQPQVLQLLINDFTDIYNLVEPAKMYASISGLFGFDKAILLDHSFIENDCIFGFHENSRRGQNIKLDCWTIHSKKAYGIKFSHLNKDQIKERLFRDFEKLTSSNLPQPVYANGHRWLYGFTEKALKKNHIYDKKFKIGICGDWCRGDTVLDASISGISLANEILKSVVE